MDMSLGVNNLIHILAQENPKMSIDGKACELLNVINSRRMPNWPCSTTRVRNVHSPLRVIGNL